MFLHVEMLHCVNVLNLYKDAVSAEAGIVWQSRSEHKA